MAHDLIASLRQVIVYGQVCPCQLLSQTVGDPCDPSRCVRMGVTLLDIAQDEVELLHEHMRILSARANQSVATPTSQRATGEQVSSLETHSSYHTS